MLCADEISAWTESSLQPIDRTSIVVALVRNDINDLILEMTNLLR